MIGKLRAAVPHPVSEVRMVVVDARVNYRHEHTVSIDAELPQQWGVNALNTPRRLRGISYIFICESRERGAALYELQHVECSRAGDRIVFSRGGHACRPGRRPQLLSRLSFRFRRAGTLLRDIN